MKKSIILVSIITFIGLPAFAQADGITDDLYNATYPPAPAVYKPIDACPVNAPVYYNTYTNSGSGYGIIQRDGKSYNTYQNKASGYGTIEGF